jgi:uncharacterized membrane protein (DUF373 family)
MTPRFCAEGAAMRLKAELAAARTTWEPLTFYQKFEHLSVLILTGMIAIIVVFAMWNLALKIAVSILYSSFDPTDYEVFQAIFGMIFTVIIGLEFKRSLLVLAERQKSIIQVRTVILIGLLAVVRKLIILDPTSDDSAHLFGLAAATLALGATYWFVSRADVR